MSAFILGFSISFLGSLPIGVLNLTASQIAVTHSFINVFRFILGVLIVEYLQAGLAFIFVKWISLYPMINVLLNVLAILVFIAMGWHYLQATSSTKAKITTTNSYFKHGLFLSAINPLAIPFWAFNITLFYPSSERNFISTNLFLIGAIIGTAGALAIYSLLGRVYKDRILKFQYIFQYLIGILFLVLAVIQIIKLTVSGF